jgi:hypothetical protein
MSSTHKSEMIQECGGAEMRTGAMKVSEPNIVFLNQGTTDRK